MTNPLQPQANARRLAQAACLACLFLSAWAYGAARPAPAAVLDPRAIQSDTLHNGLRLVVCEEENAGVVSVEIVVRVGAADDPPGQEGIAHLLEHVLWAGAGNDDPRRRIEEIGGIVNGGTLRDFTRFYATVPGGDLGLVVNALAEIVLRSTFDERVVLRECSIIRDEAAARSEHPRAALNDLAFQELYGPDHPYHRAVNGDDRALSNLNALELLLLHQSWYVPNNMAVVVVGNVTFEAARAAVVSAFGHLVPVPLPARRGPDVPRPAAGRQRMAEAPLREAHLMAAFVGPAASEHREVCASDLLAALLTHGPSRRLVVELKDRRQLVSDVGVDFLTQRDRALFGVWAVCEPEKIPAVQETIRAELRRLASEPIPAEEFASAKRLLAAGYAFANETPADRATTLAFYEAIDTYRSAAQYLPRVSLLTRDDLAEIAGWYAGEPVWVVLAPRVSEE